MEVEIQEICEKDYPEVVAIWENDLGHKITLEQLALKTDMMNRDDAYDTFVAVSEEKVVGFITIEESMDLVSPIGCLRINGIAVRHEYQRRGIGTKLMAHAEAFAKENGLSSIILNSGVKRKAAHAFYKSLGYDMDSYCFDKRI
jgi:GNAT superfamily N-acetyltransferase